MPDAIRRALRKASHAPPTPHEMQIVTALRQRSGAAMPTKDDILRTANTLFGATDRDSVMAVERAISTFLESHGSMAFANLDPSGADREMGPTEKRRVEPWHDARDIAVSPNELDRFADPAHQSPQYARGTESMRSALDAAEEASPSSRAESAYKRHVEQQAAAAGGHATGGQLRDATPVDEQSLLSSSDTGNLTQASVHRAQGLTPNLVQGPRGASYILTQNGNWRRISKKELAERKLYLANHASTTDPDHPPTEDPAARAGFIHHHETEAHGLPAFHPDNIEGGRAGMHPDEAADFAGEEEREAKKHEARQKREAAQAQRAANHVAPQAVPGDHFAGKTNLSTADILEHLHDAAHFNGDGARGYRLGWLDKPERKTYTAHDGERVRPATHRGQGHLIDFHLHENEHGGLHVRPVDVPVPAPQKGLDDDRIAELIDSGRFHPRNLSAREKGGKHVPIMHPVNLSADELKHGDLRHLNQLLHELAVYTHHARGEGVNRKMHERAKRRGQAHHAHPAHQFGRRGRVVVMPRGEQLDARIARSFATKRLLKAKNFPTSLFRHIENRDMGRYVGQDRTVPDVRALRGHTPRLPNAITPDTAGPTLGAEDHRSPYFPEPRNEWEDREVGMRGPQSPPLPQLAVPSGRGFGPSASIIHALHSRLRRHQSDAAETGAWDRRDLAGLGDHLLRPVSTSQYGPRGPYGELGTAIIQEHGLPFYRQMLRHFGMADPSTTAVAAGERPPTGAAELQDFGHANLLAHTGNAYGRALADQFVHNSTKPAHSRWADGADDDWIQDRLEGVGDKALRDFRLAPHFGHFMDSAYDGLHHQLGEHDRPPFQRSHGSVRRFRKANMPKTRPFAPSDFGQHVYPGTRSTVDRDEGPYFPRAYTPDTAHPTLHQNTQPYFTEPWSDADVDAEAAGMSPSPYGETRLPQRYTPAELYQRMQPTRTDPGVWNGGAVNDVMNAMLDRDATPFPHFNVPYGLADRIARAGAFTSPHQTTTPEMAPREALLHHLMHAYGQATSAGKWWEPDTVHHGRIDELADSHPDHEPLRDALHGAFSAGRTYAENLFPKPTWDDEEIDKAYPPNTRPFSADDSDFGRMIGPDRATPRQAPLGVPGVTRYAGFQRDTAHPEAQDDVAPMFREPDPDLDRFRSHKQPTPYVEGDQHVFPMPQGVSPDHLMREVYRSFADGSAHHLPEMDRVGGILLDPRRSPFPRLASNLPDDRRTAIQNRFAKTDPRTTMRPGWSHEQNLLGHLAHAYGQTEAEHYGRQLEDGDWPPTADPEWMNDLFATHGAFLNPLQRLAQIGQRDPLVRQHFPHMMEHFHQGAEAYLRDKIAQRENARNYREGLNLSHASATRRLLTKAMPPKAEGGTPAQNRGKVDFLWPELTATTERGIVKPTFRHRRKMQAADYHPPTPVSRGKAKLQVTQQGKTDITRTTPPPVTKPSTGSFNGGPAEQDEMLNIDLRGRGRSVSARVWQLLNAAQEDGGWLAIHQGHTWVLQNVDLKNVHGDDEGNYEPLKTKKIRREVHNGIVMPPIIVLQHADGYHILDGRHRVRAMRKEQVRSHLAYIGLPKLNAA